MAGDGDESENEISPEEERLLLEFQVSLLHSMNAK
jgi:hypothetical protein